MHTPLPPAVTFDLDSTLADTRHRWPMLRPQEDRANSDWEAYAAACVDDTPTTVVNLLREISRLMDVHIVTSRPATTREHTVLWLQKYRIPYHTLVMAEPGYALGDFKVHALRTLSKKWRIRLHVDDMHLVKEQVERETKIPVMLVSVYPPEVRMSL